MNNTILCAAIAAFVVPVAFVLALNSDQLIGVDPDAKESSGKLLYFYSLS